MSLTTSGSKKRWASYKAPWGLGDPGGGWPGAMDVASGSAEHWAAGKIPGLGCPNGGRPETMSLTTSGTGKRWAARESPSSRLPKRKPPKDNELDGVRLREALDKTSGRGYPKDSLQETMNLTMSGSKKHWDACGAPGVGCPERRPASGGELVDIRLRGAVGPERGPGARLPEWRQHRDGAPDDFRLWGELGPVGARLPERQPAGDCGLRGV